MHRSKYPTIDSVEVIESHGPWTTKSGGDLTVLFAAGPDKMQDHYFKYDGEDLAQGPDIRGTRLYTITNLPIRSVGGMEWHKIRREMIFSIAGSVRWTVEDVRGAKKRVVVRAGTGIWLPPYILHKYETLENKSAMFVFANTLFDPANHETHDTYSHEAFRELQKAY